MKDKLKVVTGDAILLVVPLLVVFLMSQMLYQIGRLTDISFEITLKFLLTTALCNSIMIVFHRKKMSIVSLAFAVILAILMPFITKSSNMVSTPLWTKILVNLIHYLGMLGVTYLAFTKDILKRFRNIILVIGGVVSHSVSLLVIGMILGSGLNFEIVKSVFQNGFYYYLIIGLAIGIAMILNDRIEN